MYTHSLMLKRLPKHEMIKNFEVMFCYNITALLHWRKEKLILFDVLVIMMI